MHLANNQRILNEKGASEQINILCHYDDETLWDKSDKLIQIIKLNGIDAHTLDDQTLDQYKNRFNHLLKQFSSEFAVYYWEVRRKGVDYPAGNFEEGYAKKVNDKYAAKIKQQPLFCNELYLAIITKPAEGYINKGFDIFKQFSFKVDQAARKNYLCKRYQELKNITHRVMNALADYEPVLLNVYEKKHIKFSEPLEFLSQLINYDHATVPLYIEDAGNLLSRKRLFFNHRAGSIEIRSGDNSKKFAAILAIKGYQPMTYQGMLDGLSTLPIEYTLTQSFRFYDNPVAKRKLRDQQKEMLQSSEESIRQTEEISDVYDETASGEVGFGLHHFTLCCYANSLDELNQHVSTLIAYFSNLDITCVREDIASECAFWAQLPGNFGFILRSANISTKNFAAFVSMHNNHFGKLTDNHWGDAVTVFETQNGSPYYFNFHYKDVGNFLVFGAMGSGKTVLVGFLILQSMKFGGKRIIFDKDRGLEILVRATGGVYETIKPGRPTGFNPCQLDDTPDNRKFLNTLFKKMLSANNEADVLLIEQVIDSMYCLDKEDRQCCFIAPLFGVKKKGSLRARFDEWHSVGTHAWLFDNEADSLNLNSQILGFDLSHILKDSQCKTPALMYLTYRIEQAILGERAILFCDEGWHALADDYFKTMINDWSRTPRKKNNIFGLATQVANDTLDKSISLSLNESAFCKIFFPNSSADRKVYIDQFGLTEKEYELVKTLPDDQHYFLFNHGRSTNKQSVVIRANLEGLEDDIAVISGREQTLLLLDQIRSEVGDDPNVWLPIFNRRRKIREL